MGMLDKLFKHKEHRDSTVLDPNTFLSSPRGHYVGPREPRVIQPEYTFPEKDWSKRDGDLKKVERQFQELRFDGELIKPPLPAPPLSPISAKLPIKSKSNPSFMNVPPSRPSTSSSASYNGSAPSPRSTKTYSPQFNQSPYAQAITPTISTSPPRRSIIPASSSPKKSNGAPFKQVLESPQNSIKSIEVNLPGGYPDELGVGLGMRDIPIQPNLIILPPPKHPQSPKVGKSRSFPTRPNLPKRPNSFVASFYTASPNPSNHSNQSERRVMEPFPSQFIRTNIPPRPSPQRYLSTPPASPVKSPPFLPMTKTPSPRKTKPSPASRSVSGSGGRENSGIQCSAITGANKRCTRMISSTSQPNSRNGTPSKILTGNSVKEWEDQLKPEIGGEFEEETRFCFQHSKSVLAERGAFITGSSGKGEWIVFDDWISPDLKESDKIKIRMAMMKPISQNDREGYIYVHEMVQNRSSNHSPNSSPTRNEVRETVCLKIGRSITPVTRLAQWKSQCASKEPICRQIFHSPLHHRLERLILLELASRAIPNSKSNCEDCGKKHCELFQVEDGAWEEWVKGVVEKWHKFCRDVLV